MLRVLSASLCVREVKFAFSQCILNLSWYRASRGSTEVLEHILSHSDCDVDPINRLEKATPLHLAFTIDDPELVVSCLP